MRPRFHSRSTTSGNGARNFGICSRWKISKPAASRNFTNNGTRPDSTSVFSPTSNAGGSCWSTASRSATKPVRSTTSPTPASNCSIVYKWNKLARAYSHYEVFHGDFTEKTFAESLRESLFQEIKLKFNAELFKQPLLCGTLVLDNNILSILVGHEPLSPDVAATCGFESGQGELLAFRHLYGYDFSLMSFDVMSAVYEKFLAHRLSQNAGRIVIEDTDELRKKEGIYYTPRYIVDYLVAHTLGEKIKPILAEAKALLG